MNITSHAYIIAEAGVNHNGSLDMAMQLVDVAAGAGADAVKFQTFKADQLVSKHAPKADYQLKNTSVSESQYEMLNKLELDERAHLVIGDHCREKRIEYLSTPFDIKSVDMLVCRLNIARLKISSGEITNAPLLLKAALSGRPVILSTGMSILGEVETALGVLAFGYTCTGEKPSLKAFQQAYCSEAGQQALRENVILLHCTSQYPTPFKDVNLRAMETLGTTFGLPVGYSDHTAGIAISIAAAARGATVIEKHFTLDRELPGPDHKASLEPGELKAMVQSIRQVEAALGNPRKIPVSTEIKNEPAVRKSLVAACDIKRGELFSEENLTAKRSGEGVSPMLYWGILGKRASKDYKQDELVLI